MRWARLIPEKLLHRSLPSVPSKVRAMVRAMPQGKRPVDPLRISNTDLLEHLPLLEALSRPDTVIDPDAPVLQLAAISFAVLAEDAVEQHAKSMRGGKPTVFRKRAKWLIESTLCEAYYVAGHRSAYEELALEGLLPQSFHEELQTKLESHELQAWRGAASYAAAILRDINVAIGRKGTRGRPLGAGSANDLVQRVDSEILQVASERWGIKPTAEQVSEMIPTIVREFVKTCKLRQLGETEQQSVDRHSKRIKRYFDEMLKNAPHGGSYVIRKSI